MLIDDVISDDEMLVTKSCIYDIIKLSLLLINQVPSQCEEQVI